MVDFSEEEKFDYDFSEEKLNEKIVYTIFGDKGTGKTTSALSFKGRIVVISFDHKSTTIKHNMYPEKKIKVYDGVRYYDATPNNILKTGKQSFVYVMKLLKIFEDLPEENKPEWIVLDGLEVLNVVCEMAMRFDRGYKPFAGITNRNDWKYRGIMLGSIHKHSLDACTKGLIYTTYSKIENIDVKDGEIILSKETPKWFGNVMMETDIVLKTLVRPTKDGYTFLVNTISSKFNDVLETGKKYIVTTKGFKNDED